MNVLKVMTKRAVAEVTLDASPNEVSNALIQIMWASRIRVNNQRIAQQQPLVIQIFGEHSVSFRSWGELVKITIKDESSKSRVIAESEALIPTTLFDLGQNKENVEILLNQLLLKFSHSSPLAIKESIF
jgi:hypothetical protein